MVPFSPLHRSKKSRFRAKVRSRALIEALESRTLLNGLPMSAVLGDLPVNTSAQAAFSATHHGKHAQSLMLPASAADPDSPAGASTIAGRYLLYGDTTLYGDVMAPNKSALLPGQTASFTNVSSYVDGIDEIGIDVNNANASYSVSDFTFLMGNTNNPATWSTAPAPISITTTPGAGAGGSTRVLVKWTDGSIVNTWLQVNFNAVGDTFYFGSLVGDTGASPNSMSVTSGR